MFVPGVDKGVPTHASLSTDQGGSNLWQVAVDSHLLPSMARSKGTCLGLGGTAVHTPIPR